MCSACRDTCVRTCPSSCPGIVRVAVRVRPATTGERRRAVQQADQDPYRGTVYGLSSLGDHGKGTNDAGFIPFLDGRETNCLPPSRHAEAWIGDCPTCAVDILLPSAVESCPIRARRHQQLDAQHRSFRSGRPLPASPEPKPNSPGTLPARSQDRCQESGVV